MSAPQSTTNEPDGEGDSSFSDSNKLLDDNQLQNSSSSPLHCPEHEENSNAEQQQSPSEQNPSTTINVDNNCATANETEQSIENSQFQVQVGSTALLVRVMIRCYPRLLLSVYNHWIHRLRES